MQKNRLFDRAEAPIMRAVKPEMAAGRTGEYIPKEHDKETLYDDSNRPSPQPTGTAHEWVGAAARAAWRIVPRAVPRGGRARRSRERSFCFERSRLSFEPGKEHANAAR
jgi:hypothetical protein